MKISKTMALDKSELRAVENLIQLADKQDKHNVKLHSNIIYQRRTGEMNDFLLFVDGVLVGYLAAFIFKLNEAEISAIIHPKFRKQGYFKCLLREACFDLQQRFINSCVLIIPQQHEYLTPMLKRCHAATYLSEYEMTLKYFHEAPAHGKPYPEITLQPATHSDLPQMAKMGAISFDSPVFEVMQRFLDNEKEKGRRAWLAWHAGKVVGKVHVRFLPNKTAIIHDLCINPEDRGKRYALSMTITLIRQLQAEGYRRFTLDVMGDNPAAAKLYEQCGFVTTSAYHYWRMPLDSLLQQTRRQFT